MSGGLGMICAHQDVYLQNLVQCNDPGCILITGAGVSLDISLFGEAGGQ